MKKLAVSCAAAAMIAVTGAAFGIAPLPTDLLGTPVQSAAAADRTVSIDASTRWINVNQGEVVKFVAGGKEFAWTFDGVPSSFQLNQVAPEGALDHDVNVTVEPLDHGAI